ncbi:neutral/alkaline non-lysosomal ceramidase N-terminal domain-containing protein [uncultured Roseibium sp.]|uniref:neutral/alkaline non-lysosomal ceramidase N-terminal domain-containing protein n=1 Tax=uncultured Roseibium sp. TaxID=1936171 RepID=UPI0032176C3B
MARKPWYRKKRYVIPILLVVLAVVAIGPWPADNTPYAEAGYFAETAARIVPPSSASGQLRAGYAEIDITPPIGHQLAGFNSRDPFESDSLLSRCFVRALTLSVGEVEVTILAVDLLLVNDPVARAVLEKSGLKAGDVFFTATHTHGGPGQWGGHPIEEIIIGDFDAAYADRLAADIAAAVTASRKELVPVEVGLATADAPDGQVNRIDPGRDTFNQLSALLFRRADAPDAPPLAALVSYGAHATVSGHRSNAISADYPGGLVDRLRETTGTEHVMFAAGTVGDASPQRPEAATPEESAVKLGERLADELVEPIASAGFQPNVTLANDYLAVNLPEVRVPVTADLRLSPVSTRWIGPERSHLHVLRVGPALLIGFPGDYAGQLGIRLAGELAGSGVTAIPTSFNGDYLGYLVSNRDFYDAPKYETRVMNFYGPWLGPYLNDLAGRMARETLQ